MVFFDRRELEGDQILPAPYCRSTLDLGQHPELWQAQNKLK